MKSRQIHISERPYPQFKGVLWVGVLAGSVAISATPVGSLGVQQDKSQPAQISTGPNPSVTGNQPANLSAQQAEKQSADTADVARKKQIADESARLLQLATDLKVEVDKTTMDMLSLNVIRKADAIEKLARDARKR
jgi:hypothetical protein